MHSLLDYSVSGGIEGVNRVVLRGVFLALLENNVEDAEVVILTNLLVLSITNFNQNHVITAINQQDLIKADFMADVLMKVSVIHSKVVLQGLEQQVGVVSVAVKDVENDVIKGNYALVLAVDLPVYDRAG